jgi:2-polyprenyl-3-methyl-5-hydroxy-6-metoxy-1,4-benzoquinol methylase
VTPTGWRCPVCGGSAARRRWRVTSTAVENGVSAAAFRPSADRYGETVGEVVRCLRCGHASLAEPPDEVTLATAYDEAADPISIEEEPGQVATADRGLRWVETMVAPGSLVDLGCWTGSLLVAAQARGWEPVGVEASRWAVQRAHARGLQVECRDLRAPGLQSAAFRAVVMADVLEHLLDPAAALRVARDLLEPTGVVYITVPDAGSLPARVLGSRWWSVLPMHVQYFTRASMRRLLAASGFDVVGMRSHPKVFTADYYAQRLEGYAPTASERLRRALRTTHLDRRAVAPNFLDRMQVLARRRG